MKKLILILFFPAFTATAQPAIDVLHYRFQVELSDKSDTILGSAAITIKFNSKSNSVMLDLVQSRPGSKGMQIDAVQGKFVTGRKRMVEEGKLEILLEKDMNAGDTATYIINYQGIPADGLIISKNKHQRRTFFADNWPNRGHNWLPCHDHPADKASVEFIITAPQQYQVVANGIQIEETNLPGNKKRTHWREDVPISTKVMVIGVAEFAMQQSGTINNCIPVYSWVYPEDRDKGFYDYALANEILPFFIKNVGPYGYKKLANVQSKTTFGGLENANTIFYSENSVTGTRKSEGLIAHEIAHQWFGNMATEKSFPHLWLSEGFATYMTILYMENKYGKDTALKMLREDRNDVISFAKSSNQPVVDEKETDYMGLLNPNSYQKGGWILHMLRRELGDSVFWRAIRKYYSRYAGSIAGSDDLRKVVEDISGKDLKQFFRQWVYTGGIPIVKVNWKYKANTQSVELSVEQLQATPFHFPLSIRFQGIAKTETLNITAKKQSFTLKVKGKPSGVDLDPAVSLLFEGSAQETR